MTLLFDLGLNVKYLLRINYLPYQFPHLGVRGPSNAPAGPITKNSHWLFS